MERANRQVTLGEELYQKQLELMRECTFEINRLGGLIIPLLSAIRKELDLPFDPIAYSKLAEEQVRKQQEDINQFVERLKEQGVKKRFDEIVTQCNPAVSRTQ